MCLPARKLKMILFKTIQRLLLYSILLYWLTFTTCTLNKLALVVREKVLRKVIENIFTRIYWIILKTTRTRTRF